ncbi:MAG: hypothetical protein NXI31_08865 [bacterium]|nr:hypothetical protein [bacterium]
MTTNPTDNRQAYIKELIALTERDARSVLLFVAFDLAVVSFVLRPATSPPWQTNVAVVLLLASAYFFFSYYRKVHLSSFEIADQLLTNDATAARAIPEQCWKTHKTSFFLGYAFGIPAIAFLIFAPLNGGPS